jgi:hypothetical protein
MYARKDQETQGVNVPDEFKDQLELILDESFAARKKNEQETFEAFGKIFPDEILLMVCFYNRSRMQDSAVSCYISVDVDPKIKQKPNQTLNEMIDLTGIFFDAYFSEAEFEDWEPNWQTTQFKNKEFFYKITRENISLSLQADALLEKELKNN